MKPSLKYSILAVGLLAAGALRGTWEKEMTRDFQATGLLSKPVEMNTRDRIGQTSSAVALGGLRTLVATFMHLRAFTFFSEQRWGDLADTYDTIVDLAPNTGYYWDTGHWHMSYDASVYYLEDKDLPPLRARALWREWILRGRAFLERGIRYNPDDWKLQASLGYMLTDERKIVDYPAAAVAYKAAADSGEALPYIRRQELFATCRVPGRETEALKMARELYQVKSNRTPRLLSILFALEQKARPSKSADERAIELFGDAKQAYEALKDYWVGGGNFPVEGVASALEGLEKRLSIPTAKSVLLSPLLRTKPSQVNWLTKPRDVIKE